MKSFSIILTLAIGFAFSVAASAADNKKLLIGKWEAVKADEGGLPVGSTVEFAADGRIKMVFGKNGKEIEGAYVLEGDSFTITQKKDGKDISYKITIKSISETALVASNSDGNTVSFKKVK